MCGICGVVGMESTERAEAITRRMMEALRHRGPDEDGLLVAPSVALGVRRLSIIDLPGGHQPVFNEASNVAVVFNGEIYNYKQLRGTLERRGHAFRTHSDTEVIVHAYEEWGEECVGELRGMFAFEVRALMASGCIAPRVAADSLEAYLLFGSVAEPSTLVEGVFSVPPGHSITLQANATPADLRPKRYRDFSAAAHQIDSTRPN